MLFNSLHFLIFFPLVTIIYFILPHKYRWVILLAASYYFYMVWRPIYALLIIGSTIVDYYASIWMERSDSDRNRKLYLFLSLFTNLGILFAFKYLLHGFLMVEDKLGMASSIETRFPLLDYDLIEYVSKLPSHYKHSSGNSKLILKKIAEGFLAKESISKKKQGFTPPELTWYGTILNKEIRHFLLSKNSNLTKLIKKEFIERTLLEIINGKDRRALIWSFIYIESWIRVFKPSNL